jgi:hypothetical protein
VWVTSITVFEARFGLALMPKGRRRTALERAFDQVLADDLSSRVLTLDEMAAVTRPTSLPIARGPAASSTCAIRSSPASRRRVVRHLPREIRATSRDSMSLSWTRGTHERRTR